MCGLLSELTDFLSSNSDDGTFLSSVSREGFPEPWLPFLPNFYLLSRTRYSDLT